MQFRQEGGNLKHSIKADRTASPVPDKTHPMTMAALALSMLLAAFGTSVANIALPTLASAFAATFTEVQWIVSAYLASLTASVVIAGKLGDRFGLRRMHLTGLAIFALASAACSAASSLPLLIAARAMQGVGAAFLMTLTMALMRETAREDNMGRAMGLLGTMSAFGTALGPAIGGMLLATAGWRGIFLVQFPLALATLLLSLLWLPRNAPRNAAPSATLRSVLTGRLASNLTINLLVAAVMMATLVVGPFYLGRGLGLHDTAVGLVMAVGPLISIVSGVPSGQIVDKFGTGRVLSAGLLALAAGAFLLAVSPGLIGVAGYILAIVVLTPGYQLFQAANNTVSLANIPKDRRGVVSGVLNLSRNIGLLLGVSGLGAVFALGVGTGDFARASSDSIAGGMQITFLLAGALMIAAIGIARKQA